MKIHEYQSRQLLEQFNIPVPAGQVIELPEEAAAAYDQVTQASGSSLAVVKAQVHAGGRGKGGGVKLVRSADEASQAAKAILSKPLVTPQTGPEGVAVKKLLIAAGVDIEKEYYLAIAVDRIMGAPILIASAEGGVEIEQVAESNPEAIIREPVNPHTGLQAYQARKVAYRLGFKGKQISQAGKIMRQLCKLFLQCDASLAEINPLIVTPTSDEHPDGQVLAIDAKIDLDDNAIQRHPELAAMDDPTETPQSERRANEHGLNFIQLDGSIGCLVNGAGLAMATMDIIKLHGSEPANFLDVGGGAQEEAVTEAFRIILADEKVQGVLVNIFGGIMKCDIIAQAIINAAKQVGFDVPLVVRLEGTNVEAARQLLDEARADIPTMQIGTDLTDAARKITHAVESASGSAAR